MTATFIVAIISVTPRLEAFAPYSWVAAGLGPVLAGAVFTALDRRYR